MPKKANHENITIKVRKEVKEALDIIANDLGMNKVDMYSAMLAYCAVSSKILGTNLSDYGSKFVKQLEGGIDLDTIRRLEIERNNETLRQSPYSNP